MKTGSTMRRGRFRRLWYAAAILGATALGAAIAWATIIPQPLLAAKPAQSAIIRQPTIWRQWLFASQLGTETAWQSVIDYFPEDDAAHQKMREYFTLRADQQLALIYLHDLDLDRAMRIFENLANLNYEDKRIETELRAFGLAGKCGVLSLHGDSQESLESVLSKLLPIRDQLTSEEMQKLVAYAIKKNRSKSGQATTSEWDEWLKKHLGDAS